MLRPSLHVGVLYSQVFLNRLVEGLAVVKALCSDEGVFTRA